MEGYNPYTRSYKKKSAAAGAAAAAAAAARFGDANSYRPHGYAVGVSGEIPRFAGGKSKAHPSGRPPDHPPDHSGSDAHMCMDVDVHALGARVTCLEALVRHQSHEVCQHKHRLEAQTAMLDDLAQRLARQEAIMSALRAHR